LSTGRLPRARGSAWPSAVADWPLHRRIACTASAAASGR